MLNISTNKVIQRYSKLKKTILTTSTITINLKRIGYNAVMNLQLKLANKNQTQQVLTAILQIPNVIVLSEYVTGDFGRITTLSNVAIPSTIYTHTRKAH